MERKDQIVQAAVLVKSFEKTAGEKNCFIRVTRFLLKN
jgi:hypothetical protein